MYIFVHLNSDYTIDYTVTTQPRSVVNNNYRCTSVPTLPSCSVTLTVTRMVFFVLREMRGTNLIPRAHPYIPGGAADARVSVSAVYIRLLHLENVTIMQQFAYVMTANCRQFQQKISHNISLTRFIAIIAEKSVCRGCLSVCRGLCRKFSKCRLQGSELHLNTIR